MKVQLLNERAKRARYPDRRRYYYAIRWTRRATDTTTIILCPIHLVPTSPPVATLSRGSRLSRCRCALHFIFVQSSLRQDPLDFFQDRLICAVVLFRK